MKNTQTKEQKQADEDITEILNAQKMRENIKSIFLKSKVNYDEKQFFVVVTDEPIAKNKITVQKIIKKSAFVYIFEDFLRMVGKLKNK